MANPEKPKPVLKREAKSVIADALKGAAMSAFPIMGGGKPKKHRKNKDEGTNDPKKSLNPSMSFKP